MPLTFPNPSRSFDETRDAVRFWGYDSAIECSFFVTRDALKRLVPNLSLEKSDLLAAFDLEPKMIKAIGRILLVIRQDGEIEITVGEKNRPALFFVFVHQFHLKDIHVELR